MLLSIKNAVKELENDTHIKAFVLTSKFNKQVFSAGLDLMEMYQPRSRTHLVDFWTSVQDCWLQLYMSPLASVACINGTSPAGGCLLTQQHVIIALWTTTRNFRLV